MLGDHHARQTFWLPLLNAEWWEEVLFERRCYLLLWKKFKNHIGHNPLAQLAMFFMTMLGTMFMIVAGFALYAEGQ